MQELLTYIVMRSPERTSDILPNIIPTVLDCIVSRGQKLRWRILNCDIVRMEGINLEYFISDLGYIEWKDLITFSKGILSINEITIFSARKNLRDDEVNSMIERRDWSDFEFCIDFFDSTEWVIFSSQPNDLAKILLNYDRLV